MADIAQRLKGLILNAVELKNLSGWPDELIEDYLNIIDNIIDVATQVDTDTTQIEVLENNLGNLSSIVDTLISTTGDFLKRIKQLETNVGLFQQQLFILQSMISAIQVQITTIQKTIFDLKQQVYANHVEINRNRVSIDQNFKKMKNIEQLLYI